MTTLKGLGKQPETTENEETQPPAEVEQVEAESNLVVYSSHPIANFVFGEFVFEKGTMSLTPEKAEQFEALLDGASDRDKALIKKVDLTAANRMAQNFLESRRVRGVDTSDSDNDLPKE
jgi:hypothetical protein